MSNLTEIVSLTILQTSVGITRQGFGTPMILSHNTPWTDRLRFYSDIGSVGADFATSSPEYLAATAILSQNPHPVQIAIGRGTNIPTLAYQLSVAQVVALHNYGLNVSGQGVTTTAITFTTAAADLVVPSASISGNVLTLTAHGLVTGQLCRASTSSALPTGLAVDTNYWAIALTANTFSLASSLVNAIALTPITLSTAGVGNQTIRLVENDVICANFVQALNLVVGKNYTAAQVSQAGETDVVTITANAAGGWFSLQSVSTADLALKQTHADPGVAADLNAINAFQPNWYGLVTLYNSAAYIGAAATAIEAIGAKVYIADSNDSNVINQTVGFGDALDLLHTSAFTRTMGAYHSSPAAMLGAAWFGQMLPQLPGSATYALKTLAGVPADTFSTTQRVNARAKKANFYQTIAGRNVTCDGTVASGQFLDITIGLDFIQDDMTKAVFGALAGAPKIPYTDAGVALLENEVRGSIERAINQGILAANPPPVIVAPLVANETASNKALRILPDLKWSATMAGAVGTVLIQGTVSF